MDKEENRPPDCKDCTKPCTVHITQIVDNQIVKMDMCEDCKHAQKLHNPAQHELMDQALGKTAFKKQKIVDLSCPDCGFTEADFKRLNRFGCPNCYEAFKAIVDKMIPQLHKGSEHIGKTPKNLEYLLAERKIKELKEQMQKAVEEENFEAAANYRDEIKKLEEDK